MKVLLVEDDRDLATGLVKVLQAESFVVWHSARGADAKNQFSLFEPDLVVLDLGLPDIDGIDVLKHIRKHKKHTPVLILTARDGLADKVNALDIGADDYLAKPFDLAELLARLRVMARRLGTSSSSEVQVGSVILDTAGHKLKVGEKDIYLPKKEYMVLKILMEEAGRVKTKEMLENNLYEWGEEIGSNAIEVHISNLRKKLPEQFIKTIRGVGYTISRKNS
ncbi:MAG: response regulator [Porticoccaceae bacterium]